MELTKRRTITMTEAASENMQSLSSSLGITQYELISILLEDASASSKKLIARAKEVTQQKKEARQKKKAIRKAASSMSTEDLSKALALLEASKSKK